jgi:hypothetical protein
MDDIIAMAREAGWPNVAIDNLPGTKDMTRLKRFEALVRADERNKVAAWMMAQGYATGHGDTMEQLLEEFEQQRSKHD